MYESDTLFRFFGFISLCFGIGFVISAGIFAYLRSWLGQSIFTALLVGLSLSTGVSALLLYLSPVEISTNDVLRISVTTFLYVGFPGIIGMFGAMLLDSALTIKKEVFKTIGLSSCMICLGATLNMLLFKCF